jgi:ATP synthase protein I
MLGWIIIVPTLGGLFLGHWIDKQFGTGIFWTGPLLFVGLAIGGWTAWKWMNTQ